ncbi:MAG: ATP-dependent DNA helicase [Anaerococcus sp.]|nr:ATP-dependent DNA helicase [Anaerococcus sp.]
MRNYDQEEIIKNVKFPALVLAGPGTGKTHTLVKLVARLIREDGLKPSRILITTFTKKAARELDTRILAILRQVGLDENLEDMMVGNFHSLARTFIEKYRDLDEDFFSRKIIDTKMEVFIINENIRAFDQIEGFETYAKFNKPGLIMDIYSSIINNLIDLDRLRDSDDPRDLFAFRVFRTYEKLLKDMGLINFQGILMKFLSLLRDPSKAGVIRENIDLVIIDEYQDTNKIQEEIAFRLSKDGKIMVLGDDDQALYAFRGADPSNLMDFGQRFKAYSGRDVTRYRLKINYRSNEEILKKAHSFMGDFANKAQLASKGLANPNSVVRARADKTDNLIKLIKLLSRYINLGQIAFLFPSFNSSYPKELEESFEKAGIKVINKKSSRFFEKVEVRLVIFILGFLGEIFPLNTAFRAYSYEEKNLRAYRVYLNTIYKDFKDDPGLIDFVSKLGTSKSISQIIYRALGLKFFRDLDSKSYKDKEGVFSNVSQILRLGVDFDEIFMEKNQGPLIGHYKKFINDFFYLYFKMGGLSEYDEDSYDKDGINFMTIHQSKGLEFEVVFVSSLNDFPRENKAGFLEKHIEKKDNKNLDFARKYYTAFTRAKRLLVILDNARDTRMRSFLRSLDGTSKISSIDFKREDRKKDKEILAYTSHISLYMTCPLKYMFIRDLSFSQVKSDSLIFGSRVHELAQYLYSRSFTRKDLEKFIKDNPKYALSLSNILGRDFGVDKSELSLKADRDFYILKGNVDIRLKDGRILDLKTGKIPKDLSSYQRQLRTYRALIDLNKGEVPQGLLYFIEEDKLIRVDNLEFDIGKIDEIAYQIVNKNFDKRTDDYSKCKLCPLKFYCGRA